MPLDLPEPPSEASSSVSNKLQQFSPVDVLSPTALGGSNPGALTLSTPHETYVLGLDDLSTAAPLESARATGWRYLLNDGAVTVASAETVETSPGEHRFALFNNGAFVESTVRALRAAAELPQVADESMRVRLLSVPGVNLVALWLHGTRHDVLIPLSPSPAGVEAGRAYEPEDLIAVLRQLAQSLAGIGPDDERGA